MKKNLILIVFCILSCSVFTQTNSLKNGTFEGRSCSYYCNEQYKGITLITVKNGRIMNVSFQIMDTIKNELFDQNYSSHFPTEPVYQKQCVEDWKGVQNYPAQLLKKQNLKKVDAMTGATWSHNLFVSSATIALKKAGLSATN